jgi:hypothetical protein
VDQREMLSKQFHPQRSLRRQQVVKVAFRRRRRGLLSQ